MGVLTLLSDFGTRDGFVAAMKGVILSIAPEVRLVDAAHDIPRGDVEAAAWTLARYWALYPPGTVHLAVVDPGVGGERRAIAARVDERLCVAPDNGTLTRVLDVASSGSTVELSDSRYLRARISRTFHGRDVFAPAAAHLASGVPLERLGPPVEDPVSLPLERPTRSGATVRGRVAHVDGFGNLISDIPAEWLGEGWLVEVAGTAVGPLKGSYSDVERGELVVLVGSADTVEIAVREGSAARRLDAARGTPVTARLA